MEAEEVGQLVCFSLSPVTEEMKLENELDPITQEPLHNLVYPVFVLEQNGKHFGFDPVALCNYIHREGKAVNPFNRLAFTQEQLQQLQRLMNRLHTDKIVNEQLDLLTLLQEEGSQRQEANEAHSKMEFALENICMEHLRCTVICVKFYDEDVANDMLFSTILPEFRSSFEDLLRVSRSSAKVVVDRALSQLMEPFRGQRKPTIALATALAFVRKLAGALRPVLAINRT